MFKARIFCMLLAVNIVAFTAYIVYIYPNLRASGATLPHSALKTFVTNSIYTDSNDSWRRKLLKHIPCYSRGVLVPPTFIEGDRCWARVSRLNKEKAKVIDPVTALCLFEPLTSFNYVRAGDKKTVVLGIGVHLGPPASDALSARCANIQYINWSRHAKNHGKMQNLLARPYSKENLLATQQGFWNQYHNDPDLKRADIIICGFDDWHCLMFAPFNKKMIINSVYRFEGHLAVGAEGQKEQQRLFYDAVRYNPDVVLAGGIVYDVMYQQHLLGSQKIIPLPSTGDYAIQRMQAEVKSGKCPGVPPNSSGYHPGGVLTISISPKRLGPGGRTVAEKMKAYFQTRPLSKYKVDIMERDMKQPYNYCDLGKYVAHIVLGYSVMSYFTLECSALGIPMFVPSPRLYAQWEKDHHMIMERKSSLKQETYDWMKENPRSLNKGFNPNDDFDMTSLERWVGYSDYFYYNGTVQFDSLEDLYMKIEAANFTHLSQQQEKHTVLNALRTQEHWKSMDSYFHGTESDVIHATPSTHPESLERGFELWKKAIARPNFDPAVATVKNVSAVTEEVWVLVDYDEYRKDFSSLPDCKSIKRMKIIFYQESATTKVNRESGCEIVSLETVKGNLTDDFKSRQPRWTSSHHFLIMAIHATQNGATTLINLVKNGGEGLCPIDTKLRGLVQSSASWKQQEFEPTQLWLVWVPASRQIAKLWTTTLYRFRENKPASDCISLSGSVVSRKFSAEQVKILEDYLSHWVTDERDNFFHVIDQLNFELAVKGFLTKSDAILHRIWLEHVAALDTKAVRHSVLDKMQSLIV